MLALAALGVLVACSAHAPRGSAPAEPTPAQVSPANAAIFVALQGALEDGEDQLARSIVASLRARPLTPREDELARSAERVLDGRALVRSLDLELVSEPADLAGGTAYRLVLCARSSARVPVVLSLPPADLKRSRSAIDADGLEGLEFESRTTRALENLELAPSEERRIELLAYELPLGRALGLRERWRCQTRSGEIRSGGEVFPAARVEVRGCERERLSPLVAGAPAAPAELLSLLEGPEPASSRALLDTALRIDPALRPETLRLLAPVVERLAFESPERVEASEPALRWLTGNRDLGRDPRGWAAYLRLRAEPLPATPVPGELDLPGSPRSGAERGP